MHYYIRRKMTDFDIKIKDKFLSKDDFNVIYNTAQSLSFNTNDLAYKESDNHVWFTAEAPEDTRNIVIRSVSEYFNVQIEKLKICQYTFVFRSKDTQVHNDTDKGNDFQTIIYIKGKDDVHSGTGFYVEKDGKYILNTHIGFMPNRLVSWTPDVYHAPLSFTDEFNPRISLITQYKLKEKDDRSNKMGNRSSSSKE